MLDFGSVDFFISEIRNPKSAIAENPSYNLKWIFKIDKPQSYKTIVTLYFSILGYLKKLKPKEKNANYIFFSNAFLKKLLILT